MPHEGGMCKKGLGEQIFFFLSFDEWIKGGALNRDVGGKHDLLPVWVVAVFCLQTHTNVTLSSVNRCVGVSSVSVTNQQDL